MSETKMRIAKYLANLNVCSRRDAEKFIESGFVKVNGEIIKTPICFVNEEDEIIFKDKKIDHKNIFNVWAYYKPVGEITTHKDPAGRKTVFDSAREKGLGRVISVGRLDINSEGLILLTNNSSFAHEMENPKKNIVRVYKVRAFGQIDVKKFLKYSDNKKLNQKTFVLKNLIIDGFRYDNFKVEFQEELEKICSTSKNFWCYVYLTEGKNREIRKVLNFLNLQVNRLIRISYGSFNLENLKPGETRLINNPSKFCKK